MSKPVDYSRVVVKSRFDRHALVSERETLRTAKLATDEAHQRIKQWIAREIEHFRASLVLDPLVHPQSDPQLFDLFQCRVGDTERMIRATLCAFAPAGVEGLLLDAIDQQLVKTTPSALTLPERVKRLREIDDELERLEVDEERAIRLAAAAGITIARRADAAPAIVLASDAELGA